MATKRKSLESWCHENNEQLLSEWHPTKNGTLKPCDINAWSRKKVWWIGKCGHEWEAIIGNRVYGNNCPYCNSRRVLEGFNDFKTKYPSVAEEWHPTKNGTLKPSMFLPTSKTKVWWLGKCGHEWDASLDDRAHGNNCPYCSGKRILKGFNDLESKYPSIAEEWHPTKNGNLVPSQVASGTHKKVWWLGKCGHEWEACISNRTYEKAGCPICSDHQVLPGFNDLASRCPDYMLDWDYSKNTIDPTTIAKSSCKKCYWKCHLCGHEWLASPRQRMDSPCKKCSSVKRISLGEKTIVFYLGQFLDIKENYNPGFLNKQELDVYVPSLHLGIEYDGEYFHKNIERDQRKNDLCKENGVDLIRIRASNLPSLSNCTIIEYEEHSKDSLNVAITALINTINQTYGRDFRADIDVERDNVGISEARYTYYVDNSFASTHPDLLAEVHPTKNGNINLHMISEFSTQRIHWICIKGHEWVTTIANRSCGSNCPFCSGNILSPGENDIASQRPDLAAEWNYEKNGGLTPDKVSLNSNKKYWWRCSKGHEWEAEAFNRNRGLCKCPVCSGIKLEKGTNDLLTVRPELAAEWNYEKNGDLKPDMVKVNQSLKIWWRCSKGHEWEATINSRYRNNNGCPFCSGRRPIVGESDLATVDPELSMDWHPTKNGDLTPEDVSPGSNRKAWWTKSCGHEWESTIANYRKSRKCPYCASKRVLPGFNDLKTKDKNLANEWHPTKNGSMKPSDFLPYSNKKVWWLGACGHEWEAVIGSRHGGRGCPYCSGQKILEGFNDLASAHPELIEQWDYERNGELKPTQFAPMSDKKVWWVCKNGHHWQSNISNRSKGEGCPVCAGRKNKDVWE